MKEKPIDEITELKQQLQQKIARFHTTLNRIGLKPEFYSFYEELQRAESQNNSSECECDDEDDECDCDDEPAFYFDDDGSIQFYEPEDEFHYDIIYDSSYIDALKSKSAIQHHDDVIENIWMDLKVWNSQRAIDKQRNCYSIESHLEWFVNGWGIHDAHLLAALYGQFMSKHEFEIMLSLLILKNPGIKFNYLDNVLTSNKYDIYFDRTVDV